MMLYSVDCTHTHTHTPPPPKDITIITGHNRLITVIRRQTKKLISLPTAHEKNQYVNSVNSVNGVNSVNSVNDVNAVLMY